MFFDRPTAGSKALLVHIQKSNSELASAEELRELALSAGLEPVGCLTSNRRFPHAGTFVGSGKLEEITQWLNHGADSKQPANLVVFGDDLSPTQERNIEAVLHTRVLGRTGLILEIFARHARTHEGQLQVELAQLEHAASRLTRGWTHLDRQRGGSGRGQGSSSGLGGAGETQLEADQRLVGDRIRRVQGRLDKVHQQRQHNRRSRSRADIKTISLAGYTNAGKSTLFNRLCTADVHVEDQLFATLDPTIRKLSIPLLGPAILSDTVGFIRQLPHTLIDAFRATLEEVSQADLLLHVVDASAPLRAERITEVNTVLKEIDAEEVPQLMVYNKVDQLGIASRVETDRQGMPTKVWMSGLHGDGVPLLLEAISQRLCNDVIETSVTLGPQDGKMRAQFFKLGTVLNELSGEDGTITMHLRIQQRYLDQIRRSFASR